MGDVYVDDMMLATLISMGFDEPISRQALAASGNSSVDTAIGTDPSLVKLISLQADFGSSSHPSELILSGSLADMADVPQHYEEPPKYPPPSFLPFLLHSPWRGLLLRTVLTVSHCRVQAGTRPEGQHAQGGRTAARAS